jgi:methylated-DNA-protein-cysteine methyltransferase-like protein
MAESVYARIWAIVKQIPRGKVATYGQVADLAGIPRHARQVGYAMHALPSGSAVPWHRVVNAKGEVSPRAVAEWADIQRQLLEDEEVYADARGRIDLRAHGWRPRRKPQRRPAR